MPRFRIRYHQPIWETTTFEAVADNEEALREADLDLLLAAAIEADEITIEQGDRVESVDSDFEVEQIDPPPEV